MNGKKEAIPFFNSMKIKYKCAEVEVLQLCLPNYMLLSAIRDQVWNPDLVNSSSQGHKITFQLKRLSNLPNLLFSLAFQNTFTTMISAN